MYLITYCLGSFSAILIITFQKKILESASKNMIFVLKSHWQENYYQYLKWKLTKYFLADIISLGTLFENIKEIKSF